MARGFDVGRRTGTTVPRIQECIVLAAQVFKKFALVTLDPALTGKIIECVAPVPTGKILGLALQGASTGPGFDISDASLTTLTPAIQGTTGAAAPTGLCAVAIADREQEFIGRAVNGGTDPQVPVQADIGKQFGVKKVSNDWVIDYTNVTDVVLQITDIRPDLSMNLYVFKFLEAVLINP